ncbi:hypothetical protein [Mycobacteroides abscessus]
MKPTEALRKVAHDALDEAIDQLMTLVGVGVGIPEGAPVGTIARRPDGRWVAHRCPAGWGYRRLRGDDKYPNINDADSWPVIYDPTGKTLDELHAEIDRLDKAEDSALRERDHWEETVNRILYTCSSAEEIGEWSSANDPVERFIEQFKPVKRIDPTAQQEPQVEGNLSEIPKSSTQQEPEECPCAPGSGHCVTTAVPKPPRAPRVVDRLGVDERGSRWRDVVGDVWNWDERGWHCVAKYGPTSPVPYLAGETARHGPFKEILEPRVLPSLDCEEARDGTAWEEPDGWRFWFNGEWRTDNGTRGRDLNLYQPSLLRLSTRSYTEVLPDVG